MSIIDTLVFDRVPADTAALEALFEKAKAGTLTEAEKAVLASPNHKGAYNYTDLNRVNSAMVYLVQELNRRGYIVSGYQADSTVWSQKSIPTKAQLKRYLDNVAALRGAIAMPPNTPTVPADMEAFTAQEANAIERVLVQYENLIPAIDQVTVHAAQPLLFCGFALYPMRQKAIILAVYTADSAAIYTADGLAVYTADNKAVHIKRGKAVYTADGKAVLIEEEIMYG